MARHLSNIFVKLDVSSRTEAAGVAFTHGLADDRYGDDEFFSGRRTASREGVRRLLVMEARWHVSESGRPGRSG